MKRPLLFKFLTIGALILLLLIPITLINGVVKERQYYSESVVRDIARSSSYSQTLIGPIVVVPYNKTVRKWFYNDKNERELRESVMSNKLYFLPSQYRVNGDLQTEIRHRGIYSARLYHADLDLTGQYTIPANYGIESSLEDYEFFTPYLTLGLSDIRGIENVPDIQLDQKSYQIEPGTKLRQLGEGVHAVIPSLQSDQQQVLDFFMALKLQGTESFDIVPIGKETQLALQSDWAHPSFSGNFLPVDREITADGFKALWQTSYFSTNYLEEFKQCMQAEQCHPSASKNFGVRLIDPVNLYVKSDRATKYALLFIGLTFAGFFLFEVLKRIQVHPVQYSLVGLSLAIFYLLLLSLSEHISFGWAYLISSISCVSLIGYYVNHVLHSFVRGAVFSVSLSVLYGLLYGLLSAEDHSMLMGSILMFMILAAVMVLTRKVNWYQVKGDVRGERENSEAATLAT